MEPASGRLTGARHRARAGCPSRPRSPSWPGCCWSGADALPRDLGGRRVVVSAGGTREPLDPVRFLGNRSSGRQGYALARVAAQRGAAVTLVAAHTAELGDPAVGRGRAGRLGRGAARRDAGAAVKGADAVVMAAAVADFRPVDLGRSTRSRRATRSRPRCALMTQPGHPGRAGRRPGARPGRRRVRRGDRGRRPATRCTTAGAKLARKGCDLLVVNAVGDGRAFEVPDNAGWLLGADGARDGSWPPGRRRCWPRTSGTRWRPGYRRHDLPGRPAVGRYAGQARAAVAGRSGRRCVRPCAACPRPGTAVALAGAADRRALARLVTGLGGVAVVGLGVGVGAASPVLVVDARAACRSPRGAVVGGRDRPSRRRGRGAVVHGGRRRRRSRRRGSSTDRNSRAAQPPRSMSYTKPLRVSPTSTARPGSHSATISEVDVRLGAHVDVVVAAAGLGRGGGAGGDRHEGRSR